MLLSPLLLRLAAPAARRCRASRRVALVSATASEPEVAAPAPAAAEAAPRAAASAPSSASSSADFDASQVKELLTESAEKLGSAWAETKEKASADGEERVGGVGHSPAAPADAHSASRAPRPQPAVITLGLFAFVGLWAVAGVLKARRRAEGETGLLGVSLFTRARAALTAPAEQGINALPFVPSLLELVGVVYSAWFVFRYLLYKPDRRGGAARGLRGGCEGRLQLRSGGGWQAPRLTHEPARPRGVQGGAEGHHRGRAAAHPQLRRGEGTRGGEGREKRNAVAARVAPARCNKERDSPRGSRGAPAATSGRVGALSWGWGQTVLGRLS